MIKLQLIFNLSASLALLLIWYWQHLQGKINRLQVKLNTLILERLTKLEKKR